MLLQNQHSDTSFYRGHRLLGFKPFTWWRVRQVFVSEQLLYTRPELERHKRTGDTEGPLAESGFRGHAHCRFCRRYFFGDNELFAHMQTEHEHCFLCRRARPDKYVYYRDYAELEGAAQSDMERLWLQNCILAFAH